MDFRRSLKLNLIITLITAGSNVFAQCPIVTVNGAKNPALNGEYYLMTYSPCSLLIAYARTNNYYIYYEKERWNIGTELCSPNPSYAYCESCLHSPFDYMASRVNWKERYNDNQFVSNYKLTVICTDDTVFIDRRTPSAVSVGIVVSILCAIFLILLICVTSIVAVKKRMHNDFLSRSLGLQAHASSPTAQDLDSPPNYTNSGIYPASGIVSAPKYEDLYPDSVPPSYNDIVKDQAVPGDNDLPRPLDTVPTVAVDKYKNDGHRPPGYSHACPDLGYSVVEYQSGGQADCNDVTVNFPPRQTEFQPSDNNSAIATTQNVLGRELSTADNCYFFNNQSNAIDPQNYDNQAFAKEE